MNIKILKLRKLFINFNIDGYIIPKNDAYFSEYSNPDRLKTISNFSGSAGFAVVLKSKNYLFVDGRYTIQAKNESGSEFKIVEIPKYSFDNIFKKNKKKIYLGFDPQLFTSFAIKNKFKKNVQLIPIKENLIDRLANYKNQGKSITKFYNLNKKITGESVKKAKV